MVVVQDPAEIPLAPGRRGLVPTMGALHEGHASLMHFIRNYSDQVVVSIFVNPTQFRPGEDFERYPRSPEKDLELCDKAGVDCVFMPTVETMYAAGQDAINVHVSRVGDNWEGLDRPGHFDGVATVVTKLFMLTTPDVAVFAHKDLQQCAVIRRLVAGLGMRVELTFAPTLREVDGLAMSSRNVYLTPDQRELAPQLYQALQRVKSQLIAIPTADIDHILNQVCATLDPGIDISYFALVNRDSMEITTPTDPKASVIIAAKLGTTRLIDNLPVYD